MFNLLLFLLNRECHAYHYRFYPDTDLKTLLAQHFDTTPFVYNKVLDYSIELPRPKERGFLFHWKQP